MRWAIAIAIFAVPLAAGAYCPCYAPTSAYNTYNCGVAPVDGINPTVTNWQPIFYTVSGGPARWGSNGPSCGTIGQGCGKPEPSHQVAAVFPCELLKAIAMQESGWRQFCVPDSPSDEVGGNSRTIISFDCGYGVGQVTSGMHAGETPSFNRTRVAGEPLYNLATGATILAGKWRVTNCVGDNQPTLIEDWYTATWAYNGLSYSNNPNNPNYSSTRGVWNPQVGGAAPYQERVFGWVENPPSTARWTSVALAYPKLSDIGTSSSPPNLPEPTCASPTSCTNKRVVHVSACLAPDGGTDGGVADAGVPDAGVRDAGVPDAGARDAGAVDAGAPDAGLLDAGAPDAGPLDAGSDAGITDAGQGDAGSFDAGEADAGEGDAGMADAGTLDSGTLIDAGENADAATSGDAGQSTPDAGAQPHLTKVTGCGCSELPSLTVPLALLWAGSLLTRRRRAA